MARRKGEPAVRGTQWSAPAVTVYWPGAMPFGNTSFALPAGTGRATAPGDRLAHLSSYVYPDTRIMISQGETTVPPRYLPDYGS
jgi:hypothetical protein